MPRLPPALGFRIVLSMSRFLGSLLLAAPGMVLTGCAATTPPAPPPEERLVVVNAGENTISVIPVEAGRAPVKISLGALGGAAADVAARGEIVVVAGGVSDQVVVLDLLAQQVRRTIRLPAGSRPVAVTMINDHVVYVANAGTNTVTRIDIATGDTGSVGVGRFPRDLLLARGRLFVVNGNVGPCAVGLCSLGPSWLSVIDPQSNGRAAGRDSIPLPSQGNARSATLGGDGLVYIINTGDVEAELAGRLTIVDPIQREEVGSFGGFGFLPAAVTSDGSERLFVASVRDGLMEFNTRTRRVVRGAGDGILGNRIVAAAVDGEGRIYAVEGGDCAASLAGRLRVFRADLTESRNVSLGNCPVAVTFVQLPGLVTGVTN